MKNKISIKDYTHKMGENYSRFITWQCDKCKMYGSTWLEDCKAEDLPEDQKRHCE